MKDLLATKKWKNTTKRTIVDALKGYYKFIGKAWEPPTYERDTMPPFIPTEQEIDILIASAGKKLATLLQLLKETGIRTDETTKPEWTDIDTTRKTIRITPSKHSNGRILPISNELIGMLNALPRTNTKIFPQSKKSTRNIFYRLRKRTANKLNNPRLQQIRLHTFRHWKATTLYHECKSLLEVKEALGHKTATSTETYVHLEKALFLNTKEHFNGLVTHNEQEELQAIQDGWELVRDRHDGTALYRKRK